MNAPIALFVYNRPSHTRQTLDALASNLLAGESSLYIFSDGPKKPEHEDSVRETRAVIEEVSGFREVHVICREENYGLAKSIISGVTSLLDTHGKVIVLEDDLLTAPHFLKYMNEALVAYKSDNRIFSISGYNFPDYLMKIPKNYPHDVYLSYRNSSWGWATWKNRWDKVDWKVSDYVEFSKDKKKQALFNRGGDDLSDMLKAQMNGVIDSWSIRFTYAHFKENVYALYPVDSLVSNIGQDGSGTHFKDLGSNQIVNTLGDEIEKIPLPKNLDFDPEVAEAFAEVFSYSTKFKVKAAVQKWIGYKHWRHIVKH